ncbi:MAG: hypothetical protein GY796_17045 [Chloroflexi bacterium]|nr:hypothetical protein [Chloroflexota bacterium]
MKRFKILSLMAVIFVLISLLMMGVGRDQFSSGRHQYRYWQKLGLALL